MEIKDVKESLNKNVVLAVGALIGVVVLVLVVNSCSERQKENRQKKEAQKAVDDVNRQIKEMHKQYGL